MAFDEELAGRVREAMAARAEVTEKAMFGGLCFMTGGHMVCGVTNDDLMLRLGVEAAEAALGRPGVRQMDFTGRPMTGYVFASGEAVAGESLGEWVDEALDFVRSLPPKG